MITVVALAIGLQTPNIDLDQKVTYETRGATVVKALSELSAITKVRLDSAMNLKGDVLMISVKEVRLKDLLDKIALADSAEWKQDGPLLRLVVNNVARNKEARDEFNARLSSFSKELEKRKKQLLELQKGKKLDDEGTLAVGSSPDNQCITQLLGCVSLSDLASAGPEKRLVFSTNPTRMQLPIRGGAAYVEKWIAAHNVAIPKDAKDADELNKMFNDNVPPFLKKMMADRTKRIEAPISKANLAITPFPFFNGVQIHLNAYDANGKSVLDGSSMMMSDDLEAIVGTLTGKDKIEKPTGTTKIVWSEDTKALLASLGTGRSSITNSMSLKLPDSLKAKLYDPEKFEPLSFVTGDLLANLAKAKSKPVVAVLSDEMMLRAALPAKQPDTVEEFEEQIQSGKQLVQLPETDWMVYRPIKAATARETRVDRHALSMLISTARKKGVIGLEDLAAYAVVGKSPALNQVASFFMTIFAPNTLQQGMGGGSDWNMLRFYGQLTPQQRSTLASGGRIPIQNLLPSQQSTLSTMVYGPNATLDISGASQPSDDLFSRSIRSYMNDIEDYRSDPTESLPNGLVGGGYVEVKVSTDQFIRLNGEDGGESFATLGADEISLLNLMKDSPMGKMLSEQMKLPESGKLGDRVEYTFVFHLRSDVSMTQSLKDDNLSSDAQTVSLTSLPSGFQSSVNAKMEQLKKSGLAGLFQMGALGGMRGGARP